MFVGTNPRVEGHPLDRHARKRKVISDNPASGVSQLYSQAKQKKKIEPLTKQEVPLFLGAVRNRKESRKHYALFFTAIHTGLRPEELAGAQIGDIDFSGKYFIVQRAIDRERRKIIPTKTSRIRRVDLSDELIEVLKEHLRELKEWWLKRKIPEGETRKPQPEWLFPNEARELLRYGEHRRSALSPVYDKSRIASA